MEQEQQSQPVKPRKRRRTRSSPLYDTDVRGLAFRILDFLDTGGGTLSLRDLKRQMNAHRYPAWAEALQSLVHKKAVVLTRTRRAITVTLGSRPPELMPKVIKSRPKRRRRKRGQSKWFKEQFPEYGNGAEEEDDDEMREDVREYFEKMYGVRPKPVHPESTTFDVQKWIDEHFRNYR